MATTNDPQENVSRGSKVSVTFAVTFTLLFVLLFTFVQQLPLAAEAEQTGSITGHVTASDGGNLGPLQVYAGNINDFLIFTATTLDAGGYYTLTGLTPGSYDVSFNNDDRAP